jgi:hypothetical protein
MNKLDWVKNYGEHESTAQSSLWHCLRMLSPFRAIHAEFGGFDPQIIMEGEKEFHTFIKTLYRNMYDHPDAYFIDTVSYDAYIKTVDLEKLRADEHKNDAKEMKLRQTFQQAIQFYPEYFYRLGLAADEIRGDDYALVLSKEKYDEVLAAIDYAHIRKENGKRLAVLAGLGIHVQESGGTCFILSHHYPTMFLGLWALCAAPDSPYKYTNYLRVDYKGFYGAMPGIEDIKMTLDEEHREILTLLLSRITSTKTRVKMHPLGSITSNHKWKVEYSQGGKRVFEFYAGPAFLVLHIFFKDTASLTDVVRILEREDPALFDWLRDTLIEKLCNCPRNRAVMFGNQKKRICGSTNKVEITNPSEIDVEKGVALMRCLDEQRRLAG